MLPKTLLTVNRIFRFGRVGGNNLFLALIAFAPVEFALVAKREAAFLSAFGAVGRPGEVFF